MNVTKGSRHRVSIEKFADKGKSIVRLDGLVVFVPGAVPGDEADIRIRRTKKKYAEADLESVVKKSELRTSPACRYFGSCGGCKWQHVDYAAQLEFKRQSVREAFEHTGGFESTEVRPVLAAADTYLYRNKMEFSFSASRWLTKEEIASGRTFDKDFALGLHAPGQFAKVIDLEECHLQSEESVRVVNLFRALALKRKWKPWNTRTQEGLLRHLVIREGKRTGDRMVNLVLSRYDKEVLAVAADALAASEIPVSTFVVTINDTPAQTALGDRVEVMTGTGRISERLGGYEFQIGPQSFFQTNTVQAERLYEVARDFAELRPPHLLYDVYCGAGTIGIFLSACAGRVVGIEAVPEAVGDARMNAGINGATNCTFVAGDVLKVLDEGFVSRHGRPDVVVVDPPRAGLHPRVIRKIKDLRARHIVYISCNPQTQARDIAMMSDAYRIDALQPVDLFPHTDHIENVARLRIV